jgi:hypothetical protein
MWRAVIAFSVACVAIAFPGQTVAGVSKTNCVREVRRHGVEVSLYVGDRACIQFGPARVIEGVWFNQFEQSRFFEGARNLAEAAKRDDLVWLTIDGKSRSPAGLKQPTYHAYYIRFVGRSALDMHRQNGNGYGHMGLSEGLVLVDRIVQVVDLGFVSPGR